MADYIETTEPVSHSYLPSPQKVPKHSAQKPKGKRSSVSLFVGTFVSAFMLSVGIILGGLMVAPVVSQLLADTTYVPQLPLAENREQAFLDLEKDKGKQLFPAIAEAETAVAAEENRIVIPSIDVNVPLVMSPSLNDADVIATLENGAALYPNGILPGRLGNTFISAHSTGEPWKGKYRFAFLRVNELAAGNIMHVDYEGARYTYTIVSKDIVKPSADFRVVSDRPVPTVTLMACWPLWSTQNRMLIKAELTNVTQLTPAPSA